jgi:hypothetical protein
VSSSALLVSPLASPPRPRVRSDAPPRGTRRRFRESRAANEAREAVPTTSEAAPSEVSYAPSREPTRPDAARARVTQASAEMCAQKNREMCRRRRRRFLLFPRERPVATQFTARANVPERSRPRPPTAKTARQSSSTVPAQLSQQQAVKLNVRL